MPRSLDYAQESGGTVRARSGILRLRLRGLVECLWTPEIDISPARFGPGSQGSQHQVVCTMKRWVQYSGSAQASSNKTWRGLVIKEIDEQRSRGKLSSRRWLVQKVGRHGSPKSLSIGEGKARDVGERG